MVTTLTGTKVEDFYSRLIAFINASQIDDAVTMITDLGSQSEKLQILSRLANELVKIFVNISASVRTLDFDFDHIQAYALALDNALTLDRPLEFALDLALDRARTLDYNLVLNRDRVSIHVKDHTRVVFPELTQAKILNQVILRVIRDDLLKHDHDSEQVLMSKPNRGKSGEQIVFERLDNLTPRSLSKVVAPYLQAVIDFERVIASLTHIPFVEPKIVSISQNSPLNIQLPGVGETINAIRDLVVPWRRKNAHKLADLTEARAQAEILEVRNRTAQGRVETKIKEEEVEQKKLETEKLRLELEEKRLDIEKRKLEIEREKIDLALSVIDRFAPQMPDRERIAYVTRLLQPLNVLIESPLELRD